MDVGGGCGEVVFHRVSVPGEGVEDAMPIEFPMEDLRHLELCEQ